MITLVLGGARSGKSLFAERLAIAAPGPVTYVATAAVDPGDADFAARVSRHRARRPSHWRTAEPGSSLVDFLCDPAVGARGGTLLVESLGTWVAATPGFEVDPSALCRALRSFPGEAVVVSEEVGLGVHPATPLGGHFRDELGEVNQAVSAVADRAYLVVAGRALSLAAAPGSRQP